MTEIHVEERRRNLPPRTTAPWLWLILAILVVALIIFIASKNKGINRANAVNKAKQTSYILFPGTRPVLS